MTSLAKNVQKAATRALTASVVIPAHPLKTLTTRQSSTKLSKNAFPNAEESNAKSAQMLHSDITENAHVTTATISISMRIPVSKTNRHAPQMYSISIRLPWKSSIF